MSPQTCRHGWRLGHARRCRCTRLHGPVPSRGCSRAARWTPPLAPPSPARGWSSGRQRRARSRALPPRALRTRSHSDLSSSSCRYSPFCTLAIQSSRPPISPEGRVGDASCFFRKVARAQQAPPPAARAAPQCPAPAPPTRRCRAPFCCCSWCCWLRPLRLAVFVRADPVMAPRLCPGSAAPPVTKVRFLSAYARATLPRWPPPSMSFCRARAWFVRRPHGSLFPLPAVWRARTTRAGPAPPWAGVSGRARHDGGGRRSTRARHPRSSRMTLPQDRRGATAKSRTSPTQSRASAAACPTRRFAFTTWAPRRPAWTTFRTACTSSGARGWGCAAAGAGGARRWRRGVCARADVNPRSACAREQLGEGEHWVRGAGGGAHRGQQVHGEERWQGRVPPARARAPVPRAAHQQDALVRRR